MRMLRLKNKSRGLDKVHFRVSNHKNAKLVIESRLVRFTLFRSQYPQAQSASRLMLPKLLIWIAAMPQDTSFFR
jgi:hypothetical protein